MTVGEWDHRQLCPDGACIGVIGTDGLWQGWGDERKRGLVAEAAPGDDDLDEGEDYDDEDDEDELEDDEDQDDDEYEDEIAPGSPAVLGALAEWNERRLCVDGACIGLLGDDGLCKVCGKVGSKAKPTAAKPAPANEDAALEAAAAELAGSALEGEGDLEARKLCPDGACVGVIGSDGHCKVCGKAAA